MNPDIFYSDQRVGNILQSQQILFDRVQAGDQIFRGMEYDPLCPQERESGVVTFRGEDHNGKYIQAVMSDGNTNTYHEGTIRPEELWEIHAKEQMPVQEHLISASFQGDTVNEDVTLTQLESFRGETGKFQEMIVNALGKMATEVAEMKQSMGYRGEEANSFCSEFSEAYNSSPSKSL